MALNLEHKSVPDTCLSSFSLNAGPPVFTLKEVGKIFGISIIAGSQSDFTAVRLLLVRPAEDASLANIIIRNCTDPRVNLPRCSQPPIVRHRDILARSKLAGPKTDLVHSSNPTKNPHPHTLTAVYEVQRADNTGLIKIIPRSATSSLLRDRVTVVAYDQTFWLEPPDCAIHLHLETTIPLAFDSTVFDYESALRDQYRERTPGTLRDLGRIPSMVYVTRTIPDPRRRLKASISLPPVAMRTIALYVIDLSHPRPNWRKQLFTMGMINKAWLLTLDLFFEVHCDPHGFWPSSFKRAEDVRPSLIAVAQSLLNGRSERALVMTKFSISNYFEEQLLMGFFAPRLKAFQENICASIFYILGFSCNLMRVELEMEFLESPGIIMALYGLQHVQEVSLLDGLTKFGSAARTILSTAGLQHLMTAWPLLSKLEATNLNMPNSESLSDIHIESAISLAGTLTDQPSQNIPASNLNTTRLPCSLTLLRLNRFSLTSPQFLRFFDVKFHRMQELDLSGLTGFTNADLYIALEGIANSLTALSLRACDIPKGDEEEHALDALVAKLVHLERLVIHAKHISWLTIERKTGTRQPHRRPATINVIDVEHPSSFLAQFPAALEKSKGSWGYIQMSGSILFPESVEDEVAIHETKLAASNIGLTLRYMSHVKFGFKMF